MDNFKKNRCDGKKETICFSRAPFLDIFGGVHHKFQLGAF